MLPQGFSDSVPHKGIQEYTDDGYIKPIQRGFADPRNIPQIALNSQPLAPGMFIRSICMLIMCDFFNKCYYRIIDRPSIN